MPEVQIQNRKIGTGHPVYFIADIAANHDGDLSRAKDLIYKAADAGADAAKFQHFQAQTIVRRCIQKYEKLAHQVMGESVYEVYADECHWGGMRNSRIPVIRQEFIFLLPRMICKL